MAAPPPPSTEMFASVGRSSVVKGQGGTSFKILAACVLFGLGLALVDSWLRGPPPIPPVAVEMAADEAAAAAAEVEAQGGLLPLPPPEDDAPSE